jgi:hypothetical protein
VARGRGEAARRSAVGGRGYKPIGVVQKAEVVRISVSPRCAPRGSEAGSFEGIPDGDAYTLSASEARRRGLKIAHRGAPSDLTAARD